MESENKYLKQIRDELKKKNGSTGHSLYNDPNSKAKYLRDIAKEIHKFNGGGGGGSDNTVIVNVTNYDDSGDIKYVTLDKSYRQIEQLLLDGKDVKIYFDTTSYFDRSNVSLLIFNPVLFLHDSITALRFLSQPNINEQESGTTLKNIYVREIRQFIEDSSDTNQFIFETIKYIPDSYVDAVKDNNGWYKIPDFDFTELQELCDEGHVVAIRAWESDKHSYEIYYLDKWQSSLGSLMFTRTTPTGAKHLTYSTGINGQYTEETPNTASVLVVDSNTSVLRVPYSTINDLVASGNVVMRKFGSTSYNFDGQNGTVFTFSNTSINTVNQTTIQIIKKKVEVPYNASGDPEAVVSPSTETITCTMDNVSVVVS